MVYLFVLHRLAGKCTEIYNACRIIVGLIKPLVLRRFRCRCGLCKISAVVVYKKSRCRLISVLFASIFLKSLKISKRTIIVFHTGKRLPMEISGNSPRNFWSNGKRPRTGKPPERKTHPWMGLKHIQELRDIKITQWKHKVSHFYLLKLLSPSSI